MNEKHLIDNQIAYLQKVMESMNFPITEIQISQFEKYLLKIIQWNKRINLISKNDEKNIVSRHFLESIAVLDIINFPLNSIIIDVGTGAGFPGLPLKIIRPDIKLTLLDSKRFKTIFLADVLKALNLEQVAIVRERAEIACIDSELTHKFDFLLSRAVAKLSKLYEWTSKFLKPGASILAIKGGDLKTEVEEFRKKYPMIDFKILPLRSKLIEEDRDAVIVQIFKTLKL